MSLVMPKINPRFVFIAWSLVAALSGLCPGSAQDLAPAVPEAAEVSSDRLERLDSALRRYVADEHLAGTVALVARHGQVVFHEAFGMRDIESGEAMQKDSISRIASQSKALVSVAIMALQEQGRLLVTDPLSKYLPEFESTVVAVENDQGKYDVVPSRRAITLRDLLTHTAGIGYGYGPAKDLWEEAGIQGWYFANREEKVGQTVARIAKLPFDAHPGEE